jgi:hypothetical protein
MPNVAIPVAGGAGERVEIFAQAQKKAAALAALRNYQFQPLLAVKV